MQKSFEQILSEHLGEYEDSNSYTTPNSLDEKLFGSWQMLKDFATKNIKTHIAKMSYGLDVQKQERKRQVALEGKYKKFVDTLETKELKEAAQFFFNQGMSAFLDGTLLSLKKDFRRLAKLLHPDLVACKSDLGVKVRGDFKDLKVAYDLLNMHFLSKNSSTPPKK